MPSSFASLTTYSDEAAFLTAATPNLLESFEGFPTTTASLTTLSTSYFDINMTGTNDALGVGDTAGQFGPTNGSQYVVLLTTNVSSSTDELRAEFTFANPTFAIGLWVMDFGDAGASPALTFDSSEGGGSISPPAVATSPMFFGLTSDIALTTFTLVNNNGRDFISIDEVRLSQVPIPAALPLFLSALGGLGFIGWRRKKVA